MILIDMHEKYVLYTLMEKENFKDYTNQDHHVTPQNFFLSNFSNKNNI